MIDQELKQLAKDQGQRRFRAESLDDFERRVRGVEEKRKKFLPWWRKDGGK